MLLLELLSFVFVFVFGRKRKIRFRSASNVVSDTYNKEIYFDFGAMQAFLKMLREFLKLSDFGDKIT